MFTKISYTVFVRILSMAVNVLTFILTAKYFGAEGRGNIAAVSALLMSFTTIAGFSIGRVLVFEIGRSGMNARSYFHKNLFSLLGICLLLSLVVFISGYAFWMFYPTIFGTTPIEYYALYFLAAPSIIWQGYSSYIFASLDNLIKQNKILLISMCIYVSVIYIAILLFHIPFVIYLLITLLYILFTGIFEFIEVVKIVGIQFKFYINSISSLFKKGLSMHVDTIGGLLITSSNILLINSSMQASDTGVFQFAAQFISMMIILPTIVSLQFNADITALGADKAFLKHKKFIWGIMIIMLVGCSLAWFLAPWLILLLGGTDFVLSTPVFQIMLISVIGNSFSVLLSSQYSGRGYFKLISGLTIILGSFGLIFSYFGIKLYGLYGAAWATNAVYTLSMLVNLIFYWIINKRCERNAL